MFQKNLKLVMKMQTFMPSSNMKNEQQRTFQKKVTSKRRGNNQDYYAFPDTKLFSMVYNFFCKIYFQFSQKFCIQYKILQATIPMLNFLKTFFEILLVLFGNFEAKKRSNG